MRSMKNMVRSNKKVRENSKGRRTGLVEEKSKMQRIF